jgi:hypothetical protein
MGSTPVELEPRTAAEFVLTVKAAVYYTVKQG